MGALASVLAVLALAVSGLAAYLYRRFVAERVAKEHIGAFADLWARQSIASQKERDQARRELAEAHEREKKRDAQIILADPTARAAVERLRALAAEVRAGAAVDALRGAADADVPGREP